MVSEAFHVTLRSADGFDGFHERKLTLQLGHHVTIGRASRNPQKPELMTALNNAFIDSPVISREHAALTVRSHPPAVYIADNGSMHGTLLNGEKLEAHQVTKLTNGDMLQFGADVTRDRDHFVARKYTFESTMPDASFALGFTVPDADTSEDEDVEAAMSSPPPAHPRYGSQTNPATVDSPEDIRQETAEREEEEVAILRPVTIHSHESRTFEELVASFEQPPLSHVALAMEEDGSVYSSSDENSPWPFVDDQNSIDEHDSDGYNSSPQSIDYNDESDQASHLDDSESDSEHFAEDIEEDEGEKVNLVEDRVKIDDAVCRMKLKTMLNHQEQMATPQPEPFTPVSAAEPSPTLSTPSVEAVHRPEPTQNASSPPEHESSVLSTSSPTLEDNDVSATSFAFPSPQIAYPKSTPWGSASEYVSPYMPRESNSKLFSDIWTPNHFFPTPPSYTASPFSNSAESENIHQFIYQSMQSPTLSESHTPLAATTNAQAPPSADVSYQQPARRTKVSIPEIVEDVPPQPPTPTSMSGGSKRKAEVLDEEVVEVVVNVTLAPETTAELAPVIEAAGTPVLVPAERPKKRLRSAFGGVAKTMAGLLLPGTAIAVGVLTQLPREFWTS